MKKETTEMKKKYMMQSPKLVQLPKILPLLMIGNMMRTTASQAKLQEGTISYPKIGKYEILHSDFVDKSQDGNTDLDL